MQNAGSSGEACLQEHYAPHNACFGCGPANSQGLRVRSFDRGDHCEADWKPSTHHEAFPGVVSGGIIGTLLDCHSNWTAAWTLMKAQKLESPPCTVTADYAVKLLRPTPSNTPLHLVAKPVAVEGDKVKVEAELRSGDRVCATCSGTFVAVKPGHPAFHRW